MTKKRVVVGEDDPAIRSVLVEFLESLNYEVTPAGTCATFREAFRSSAPTQRFLPAHLARLASAPSGFGKSSPAS